MANIIQQLRTEKGITQAELAKLLDVSPSAIGMYEQGRRKPDINTCQRLANILGVQVSIITEAIYEKHEIQSEIQRIYDQLTPEQQKELMEFAKFKASQNL